MEQTIGMLIFIGCISAIFAMAAGLYELSKINNNESITKTIDIHMYAAVIAWCFYSASLSLRWVDGAFVAANSWAIITSMTGFISLTIAGWQGANLVYQYGLERTFETYSN